MPLNTLCIRIDFTCGIMLVSDIEIILNRKVLVNRRNDFVGYIRVIEGGISPTHLELTAFFTVLCVTFINAAESYNSNTWEESIDRIIVWVFELQEKKRPPNKSVRFRWVLDHSSSNYIGFTVVHSIFPRRYVIRRCASLRTRYSGPD